jgi:hypothetical protein
VLHVVESILHSPVFRKHLYDVQSTSLCGVGMECFWTDFAEGDTRLQDALSTVELGLVLPEICALSFIGATSASHSKYHCSQSMVQSAVRD